MKWQFLLLFGGRGGVSEEVETFGGSSASFE